MPRAKYTHSIQNTLTVTCLSAACRGKVPQQLPTWVNGIYVAKPGVLVFVGSRSPFLSATVSA